MADPHISRRQALMLSASAVALVGLGAPPAYSQTQRADTIWFGGPILTMNDKAMRAEAVAVANGKIIAVGKRANVMQLRGPKTQLVDLKGRALVPGAS
jgi:adenine deaminase